MGGCASKPKDLKAEFASAPEPEPAPSKEEAAAAEEAKEVETNVKKGDGAADDDGINLFKEGENEKTPPEPVKKESPEIENANGDSPKIKVEETEKKGNPVEQTATLPQVDAVREAEVEKTAEVAAATAAETLKPETSKQVKETEDKTTPMTEKKTEENKPDLLETREARSEEAKTKTVKTATEDDAAQVAADPPKGNKAEN